MKYTKERNHIVLLKMYFGRVHTTVWGKIFFVPVMMLIIKVLNAWLLLNTTTGVDQKQYNIDERTLTCMDTSRISVSLVIQKSFRYLLYFSKNTFLYDDLIHTRYKLWSNTSSKKSYRGVKFTLLVAAFKINISMIAHSHAGNILHRLTLFLRSTSINYASI